MGERSGHASHFRWPYLLIAVLLVAFTASVRWALADTLGDRAACLIFLPAVALSAYLGGLWPGLLATVLSAAAADVMVMHWFRGVQQISPDEVLQVVIFVLTGAFVSFLTHTLHRTDLARSRSEERYRTFIRQSSEGIWRMEMQAPVDPGWPEDRQIDAFFACGRLAECNDAMARMYGYDDAAQIIGAPLGQLLVRDDPANVEYLRNFIRNGYRLSDAESHEHDRNGRDKYFLNNLVGIIEDGLLVRAWGTQRDVTEQREAQQRLSLYREIFAHSNDAIGVIDARGKYIEQNAAHRMLTGYSDDELRDQTPAIHLGEERFEAITKELIREGVWRGEAVSHIKSGAEIPIEMSAFAVRDRSGNPLCYVGIKRDMTARKRAEIRLTAEHAVTRILADSDSLEEAAVGVLHAIRTALHAQIGVLWLPDESGEALRCACVAVEPEREAWFEQFSRHCREVRFTPGQGMPGQVWQSRAPTWIVDVLGDPTFTRRTIAQALAIRSGMAFPVQNAGRVFGVVEFFTNHLMEPDPGLLSMMAAIGLEIGQFILRREAEQQLRRSQSDLSDFVENASVGLHWVGPDGTILWANQAELDLLGYAREEYVGRNIAEFHVEPEIVQRILGRLSQGQTLRSISARLKCRDGSIRHVLIDTSGRWEQGNFIHSRCFTRDVTEQVRFEEALRASEQSLRLALEAGRMGTWEWEVATGRVTWSPGLEAIHGLQPGQFAGTFEAFVEDIHPDDREQVLQRIQATIAERRDHHIEYRLRLADGTERWVEGRGKLYCDHRGQPVRMVGVCTDITERKRGEERERFLSESTRLLTSSLDYNEIFRSLSRMAVPVLGDFCFFDVLGDDNRLRRMAWAHVDPQRSDLLESAVSLAPSREFVNHPVNAVLRTGQPMVVPEVTDEWMRNVAISSEHLKFMRDIALRSVMTVPLMVGETALGAMTFCFSDSRRRHTSSDLELGEELGRRAAIAIGNARLYEAEQNARLAAERANRAKDEFLAVLSHELRTPLTPVLLTVELLENSGNLAPELCEDLQTIRQNVELEARLIDDLLDLTRISRGKLQLSVQTTDIHALVRNAIEICHRSDEAQLVVDLTAERHHVRADPARLQQVFWNLLNNAHKFTPTGGTITVRSRNTADGRVRVEVCDTGIGIDAEHLPRIFSAFEQGHSDSRRFGGLGLGLAISRALMDAQGGVLSAHSDGPNTGATFAVELPVVRAQVARPVDAIEDDDGRASAPRLRILVVEDHEPTRCVMTKLLADLGHVPHSAAGMASAMKIIEERPIDLVISDLGLPDGSGHELMQVVRQRFKIPGIALSGYGMEQDIRRSEEAGFAEHLTKPIDLSRLESAIRRVASLSGAVSATGQSVVQSS